MNEPWRTNGLFCDGGVIQSNPSPVGGTYAFCLVEHDKIVKQASGILLPEYNGGPVTNNLAELVAAVQALETVPESWSGYLCSDSRITIGRLFWGVAWRGVPSFWIDRATSAVWRFNGGVKPVLLQGHPTKADLARGIGAKRDLPVSRWNVWCDEQCQREAREALAAAVFYGRHTTGDVQ